MLWQHYTEDKLIILFSGRVQLWCGRAAITLNIKAHKNHYGHIWWSSCSYCQLQFDSEEYIGLFLKGHFNFDQLKVDTFNKSWPQT